MKKINIFPKERVKKPNQLQPLPLTQLSTIAAGTVYPCPDCPE